MIGKKLVAVLGALACLGVSQQALAQSRSVTAIAAEEEMASSDRSPFSGSVGLGTRVGSGTFIADRYSDTPLVVQSLSLGGSYRLDLLPFPSIVSVRQSFSFEYTQPQNRNGRKWDYSDTSISLMAPRLWRHEDTGLVFSAGLSASVPISFSSIAQRKYTTLSFGPSLSLPLDKFYFSLGGGLAKHFYKYSSRVNTQDDVSFGELLGAYCREGEVFCRGGPYFMSWSLSLSGTVAYSLTDELSASLSGGWGTGWTFDQGEPDEFSTTRVENPGRSRRPDSMSFGVGASYLFSPLISMSAGINTSQSMRTMDQKGIRNPFFTKYRRNNTTAFSLNLSAGF